MRELRAVLLLSLALFGCDGGTTPADGGEVDGGLAIAPPAPAAAPDTGWDACPEGWVAEATGCDPWPGGELTCAADEARFPGRGTCERIGTACVGEWAPDLPASGVIFVRAGETGGDGSEAAPYGTIAEGLAAALPGTVVALAAGRYDEAAIVPADVELRGSCVTATIVAGPPAPGLRGTIQATGAGAVVSNLTITGDRMGVYAGGGARMSLRDAIVEDAIGTGIFVLGATLEGERVVVRRTRALADGLAGRGVDVEMRGSATLRHVRLEENHDFGAFAAGATLSLEDSVIEDTVPQADGTHGRALNVIGGATATVARSALVGSHEIGALITQAGSSADLTDVLVSGVAARGEDGVGLSVEMGASATLTRVRVEGAQGGGLMVNASRVTASQLHVRDILPGAVLGLRGMCASATSSAELDVSRAVFERCHTVGVAGSVESRISLTDTIVRDVSARASDGDLGVGIGVTLLTELTLRRVLVERTASHGVRVDDESTLDFEDLRTEQTGADENPGVGLFAFQRATVTGRRLEVVGASDLGILLGLDATTVAIEDARVTGTRPVPTGDDDVPTYGAALQVEEGGAAELTRVVFEDNAERGVGMLGGGRLILRDAIVRGTREASGGELGRGASVAEGSELTVERGLFEDNHETAVLAMDLGTVIRLTDVEVRGTRSRSSDGEAGRGLTVQTGARVELTRVRVLDNREAGLLLLGEAATVIGTEVDVTGTLRRECADTTCEGAGAGCGVTVNDGSRLELAGFLVEDNALCGIQLAGGASIALSGGVVRGHPIGANVQAADFDYRSLTDGVRFEDNERNIDATILPLPDEGLDSSGVAF